MQTVKVAGGFAAEAVAGDVEHEPRSRNLAAAGNQWIDQVAGARREHEIAGR
jgi:hypothetical protein